MKHFGFKYNWIIHFSIVFSLFVFNKHLISQQFSEVMFTSLEANSEFVEIFNNSENPIDLQGYKIKYHSSKADEIYAVDSNYILEPNQYAVIFEADYDFANGIYSNILPNKTLKFILDDNAFGSSGMSNSSDRAIYLMNKDDDTLEVYTYSANNQKGYSDERFSFKENLWKNSKILNGTPGKRNSIAPNEYDLEISDFYVSSNYVILGKSLQAKIEIKNLGIEIAENFLLEITINNTSIFSQNFLSLLANDSMNIEVSLADFQRGKNIIRANIVFTEDEFVDNNYAEIIVQGISINEEAGDIIINEFIPAPTSPEPEWIEIFNKSEKEINLRNYKIADASDTLTVITENLIMYPNQYFVLADDSSFFDVYSKSKNIHVTNLPTLNNSGDKIIILDSLFRTIDSLEYSKSWNGRNGKSFERIDPFGISNDISNWISTVLSTPGKINSVTQKEYDVRIDTVFTDCVNPIVETQCSFITVVENVGKQQMEFSVTLFDDADADSLRDNLIEETQNYILQPGEEKTIEFSSKIKVENDFQNYIVIINATDDDTTNNIFFYELKPSYEREAIVINEIMYLPTNYEPEWVEFYNNSEYDINLLEWEISDVLTNPISKKIEEEIIIEAGEYFVITKSNSIYEFHKEIKSKVIELAFANLNNAEDGIVFKDHNGRTIDSVRYNNDFEAEKGKSIERKNILHNSNNLNNWHSSIDLEGSTPGRINSITPKDYDLIALALNSEPQFPVEGEEIRLKAKIKNYGNKDVENFSVQFFLKQEDNYLLLEEIENLSCASDDSIFVTTSEMIKITDTLKSKVNITFNDDQDEGNNVIYKTIIPGFNMNAVLINEIMFKPNEGEPQWVEIINNTDSTINLNNWLIGDSKEKVIIINKDFFVDTKEFVIIASNKGVLEFDSELNIVFADLPSFNKTKDAIVIYDYRNAIIDSAYYSVASNFKKGVSLERIASTIETTNPENWSFCLSINGSTPGKANSVSELPEINFGEIIISEIMYNPSETNSEFIEFFNRSKNSIEIGGCKLKVNNNKYLSLINKSFLLKPNQYLVVSADSNILNNYEWLKDDENIIILNVSSLDLSNSSSKINLVNIKNNTIDLLHYFDSWHNSSMLETKNISLELLNVKLDRNNSRNWSSSVSAIGATPGRVNSINVESTVTKAKLNISPNPFSPDNDGFEDFTYINYNLTEKISQVRIRIFDSKGRFVRNLAENVFIGSSGSIVFDGLDQNNNPLKTGIYIILFQAINNNNAVVETIKDVVVIAREL